MSESFESDDEAIEVLESNGIKFPKGLILLPRGTKDARLLNACDYLCSEWDYAIEWIPGSKPQ